MLWMTCLDPFGAKTTSTFLPAKASPGVQASMPARRDIMVTLTFTAAAAANAASSSLYYESM